MQAPYQGQQLPSVQTDYIGSALWEQVILSPMRTVVAKLITAPRWQLILGDGSPDIVVTGITTVNDGEARRVGEREYAFCLITPMRVHSSNQEIGPVKKKKKKKHPEKIQTVCVRGREGERVWE